MISTCFRQLKLPAQSLCASTVKTLVATSTLACNQKLPNATGATLIATHILKFRSVQCSPNFLGGCHLQRQINANEQSCFNSSPKIMFCR